MVQIDIIQEAPVFLNLAASVDKAVKLSEARAAAGAQIVVFPETWLPGYPVWLDYAPGAAIWDDPGAKSLFALLFDNSIVIGDSYCQSLQALSDKTGVVVVIGVNERVDGTIFNSIFYVVPGQEIAVHRKLMPTYSERMVWGRGDGSTLTVVDSPAGRIGGLVCWEHWMPLARAAMHQQQEEIHVALWPYVKEMNLIASRHYAFEGRSFVVAAGCTLSLADAVRGCATVDSDSNPSATDLLKSIPGDDDLLLLAGGSAVIAPNGDLSETEGDRHAQVVSATIDPGIRTPELLTLDAVGHYSRPDVFRLNVDISEQVGVEFTDGRVGPKLD